MTLSKAVWPVLWSLLSAVLPVVVNTTDGERQEGTLQGVTASSIRLDHDGRVDEIPFDALLSVQPAGVESRTGPNFRVLLSDGSSIAAEALSSTDSELVIQPRRQSSLQVPFKQIKAIRFRAAAAATDPQWLGILEREQRGDVLVIRRSGDRLDPQQGVVTSVSTERVGFDLDGTAVNAPVDKLEGVVFAATEDRQRESKIQVTDVYGSSWRVTAMEPSEAEGPLRIRLSGALRHELPLDQVASIRWSTGVLLLAQQNPADAGYRAYLQTSVDPNVQAAFFGPTVDGDADLRMHGGSSVEYRVEDGFQTFAGSVERHRDVSKASSVTVKIDLDGRTVWTQTLLDSDPRGFELPLDGARRLAIRVESDGDGDLGDLVRIARPRLLK